MPRLADGGHGVHLHPDSDGPCLRSACGTAETNAVPISGQGEDCLWLLEWDLPPFRDVSGSSTSGN